MRVSAVAVGIFVRRDHQCSALGPMPVTTGDSRLVLLLPVVSALTLCLNQTDDAQTGGASKARPVGLLIQGGLLVRVRSAFFLLAGMAAFVHDRQYAVDVFPAARAGLALPQADAWIFSPSGGMRAVIGILPKPSVPHRRRPPQVRAVVNISVCPLPCSGAVIFGDLHRVGRSTGLASADPRSGLFVSCAKRKS